MTNKTPDKSKEVKRDTRIKVAEESGLLQFLLNNLPGKSRTNVKSLLSRRQVWVGKKVETHFDFQLKAGDEVSIEWSHKPEEINYRGLRILHEDSSVIVIEKDAGLLSIATSKEAQLTAYSILSGHVKAEDVKNRIFILHRLDKGTSGLMMFARSEAIQEIMQKQWHDNVTERIYIAVVEGCVENDRGRIRSFLKENKALMMYSTEDSENGDEAITTYNVIKRSDKFSMLEVELDTGRKNQIRVHMKDIGHSVVGDTKYNSKVNPIGRMGLHAKVLEFKHPVSGKIMRFETPIPQKFLSLFK